jgi:hypothetical protein
MNNFFNHKSATTLAAFLCCVCLFSAAQLSAQNTLRNITIGVESLSGMTMAPLFNSIGFYVAKPISKRADVVTGISYDWAKQESYVKGGVQRKRDKGITVPLLLRYHFWKYVFVDGGIHLDTGTKWKTSGNSILGAGFGAGLEYQFASGWRLSLRTAMRWPTVLTSAIGVGYKF